MWTKFVDRLDSGLPSGKNVKRSMVPPVAAFRFCTFPPSWVKRFQCVCFFRRQKVGATVSTVRRPPRAVRDHDHVCFENNIEQVGGL